MQCPHCGLDTSHQAVTGQHAASNMSWKQGRRETVLGGHCWHVAQGTLPEIQKGLWEKLRVEREGVACINWRKNGLIMVFS